ncbi:hypothetical protein E2C01_081041 [Portunus trituberculatus]|uniref:Uncharacterized protein n=1 Tax=Portunus trituberculatus TaxID=210409 RepID=A0A5B7IL70_PORTR|nr:hypothetical protein [Portunus trituberculatus]
MPAEDPVMVEDGLATLEDMEIVEEPRLAPYLLGKVTRILSLLTSLHLDAHLLLPLTPNKTPSHPEANFCEPRMNGLFRVCDCCVYSWRDV